MIRSSTLKRSAIDCPACMACGKPNHDGHQLCLAHSNELADGRGAGFKSHDALGALICWDCHDQIDGRKGRLSKEEKHDMHRKARERTLIWWLANGYLVIKAA